MGLIDKIVNFMTDGGGGNAPTLTPQEAKENLNRSMPNIQLQRIRQDIQTSRDALNEAEQAWYPFRVKMQRMYLDTVNNGHITAAMQTYKDLVLLKDYRVTNGGEVINEEWTKYFKSDWFYNFMSYALDADFYGYQLIALGDVVNNQFPNLTIVKRHNISPDRLEVSPLVYNISGTKFLDEPWRSWHVWVDTPTDNAISNCGYGLLYKASIYEIFLRNILGYNGDFVELFAQPFRVGKTMKTSEDERAELAYALQQMGSSGWTVIDPEDSIEFLETALGGNGYKGYESLELRCQKYISKIFFGHSDVMDSIVGKLGSGQNEDSPVAVALRNKQTTLMRKMEHLVNTELIPRLRALGIKVPNGLVFEFYNDYEKEEYRNKVDASNKVTAEIFQTIKNAGGKPDWAYFSERTGIPVMEAPIIAPVQKQQFKESIQNKLNKIYSHKH